MPFTQQENTILQNLQAVLASGNLGDKHQSGSFNRRLEHLFQERLSVCHALTMNSGTAALHTALVGLGVQPGDEVIVDPFLRYAASAVLYVGATPIFADVAEDTFLMDPKAAERCCSNRTKAIVCTALFGLLPQAETLYAFSRSRNIRIVEDCAQAILAQQAGRLSGTQVDVSIFSFQNSKHLSTGEGGLLATSDTAVYQRAQAFREHGWYPGSSSYKDSLGYMYRMPELCAAVGVAKFSELDKVIEVHRRRAQYFSAAVRDVPWVKEQHCSSNTKHVYWVWAVRIDGEQEFTSFVSNLSRMGSDAEIGYCKQGLVYMRPLFQRDLRPGSESGLQYRRGLCPIAEAISRRMVHLRIDAHKPEDYYLEQAEIIKCATAIK